jgi:hypothetical protein
MVGVVADPAGAVVAGAKVEVKNQGTGATWSAVTDASGRWSVTGLPSGRMTVTCVLLQNLRAFFSRSRGGQYKEGGHLASGWEPVTVTAEASLLKTESGELSRKMGAASLADLPLLPPSGNVTDLQRRVTGVLPIAVSVPRTGSS